MGIGISLLLIAVGAILAWAVSATVTGIDIRVVGAILMVIGIIGLLLSLLFWGWLWGPVGMLLSVPLTVTIKILLERSADWGWVAILLDSGENAPAAIPAGDKQV